MCSQPLAPVHYPPENARDGTDLQAEELESNHTHYLLLESDGQYAGIEAEGADERGFRMRSDSCARDAVYEGMSEAELGRFDLRDIALKVDI